MTTTHIVNYGQHDAIEVGSQLDPSHGYQVLIAQGDTKLMPMPGWDAVELAHAILAAVEDIGRLRKARSS